MTNNFLLFILILIILLLICIVRFDQKKNENEHFISISIGIAFSGMKSNSKKNSNNQSQKTVEPTEKPTETPRRNYEPVQDYNFTYDNLYDLVDCKKYDFLCKTRTEKWEYQPYFREQTVGINEIQKIRNYR